MAEAQLRNPQAALEHALRLGRLVEGNPAGARQASLLQAELALRAGRPEQALQALPPAEPAVPGSQRGRAGVLLRSEALIARGQPRDAAAALQGWVAVHALDAGAWRQLARAQQASGQPLRQLRAEGEAQMSELDFSGAIDRWRAAQDLARHRAVEPAERIDASIVDARLADARRALDQQRHDEQEWS